MMNGHDFPEGATTCSVCGYAKTYLMSRNISCDQSRQAMDIVTKKLKERELAKG